MCLETGELKTKQLKLEEDTELKTRTEEDWKKTEDLKTKN